MEMQSYLDQLASSAPAPGGGSAAALAGALAAALESMVCNFTVGREKFASVEQEVTEIFRQAEQIRGEMTGLMQSDIEVYQGLSRAFQLPRVSDSQKEARTETIQQALKQATEVPLKVLLGCYKLLRLCQRLVDKGNPGLVSDVGVAAALAQAGIVAANLNIEINLGRIKDPAYVDQVRRLAEPVLAKAPHVKDEVMEKVAAALKGEAVSP